MSRKMSLTAVVAMSVALVAGLGCEKKKPQISPAEQAPAAQNEQKAPAAEPKIAGIVFQEDQFFRLVLFGMKDAAAKGGALLLEANSGNKLDKEIQLVNTYISRKVDAIVISPLSATASVAALQRAREQGIKVVTYNSTVEGDLSAAYIESDQANLGALSGASARAYIEEKLGGKANVAILAFKSQVPEQSNARSEGFRQEVTKLPGVKVVAEQDAWLAEMAVKKVGDILTANKNINVIWAANEGGTVGAVMAVNNAGKAGKVAVFGTDISEQLLSFLKDTNGTLQAIAGQRPFEIGAMATNAALSLIKGQPVEKKVSIPGVLLSRKNPEEIDKYEKHLKELISLGANP